MITRPGWWVARLSFLPRRAAGAFDRQYERDVRCEQMEQWLSGTTIRGLVLCREAHTMREFFFHISAYCHDGQRPQLGTRCALVYCRDDGDRSIAVGVWQHKVAGTSTFRPARTAISRPFPHARDELRKWLRITPHRIVVATAALAGVLYIVQQTLVLPGDVSQ